MIVDILLLMDAVRTYLFSCLLGNEERRIVFGGMALGLTDHGC